MKNVCRKPYFYCYRGENGPGKAAVHILLMNLPSQTSSHTLVTMWQKLLYGGFFAQDHSLKETDMMERECSA